MSYQPPPPPPPVTAQPQKQSRPGTGLLATGLALLGVSIIGGIVAVWLTTAAAFNALQDFVTSTHQINEHVSIDGLGDHRWFLYQEPSLAAANNCSVVDDHGNDITEYSVDMEVTIYQYSYEAIQSFHSSAGEVYEINCDDYPVLLGGAIPLSGLAGVLAAIATAAVMFLAGGILTVIGAVKRSRSNPTNPSPTPYGPGPPVRYSPQPPPYDPGQRPPYA